MSIKLNCSYFSLADFEYELPSELIAKEPVPVRHQSRLMSLNRQSKTIAHHHFSNLPELLVPGDLLVVNDTQVLSSRLLARRQSGGLVELLLLHPQISSQLWEAMAFNLRRLKPGEVLYIPSEDNYTFTITVADIITSPDGQKRLLVDLGPPKQVFNLLSKYGFAPLPPYLGHRVDNNERLRDIEHYQTVFARAPGAVAAPTAGLHFSQELIQKLKSKEIEIAYLTLHVGPGTFKPITTSLEAHIIEAEEYSIPEETALKVNNAIQENRRVIAVGTTSCRALESAGVNGILKPCSHATTSLYIRPEYNFQIINGLITNFHLSRSSLLVLVSAFAGHELIMHAYQEAISSRYRFYSWGDAMLIL